MTEASFFPEVVPRLLGRLRNLVKQAFFGLRNK